MARASGRMILALAIVGSAILTAGLLRAKSAPSDGALRAQDALPPLSAGTLVGTQTALPEAIRSNTALLIFTFSKGAGSQATSWRKALQERYGETPRLEIWQVISLEDVPGFFRGMVTRSLSKGIPESMHGRTLLLFQDSEVWKRRVGMRDAGIPCAVLLDAGRSVRWAGSGAADGTLPPDLQAGIDALLSAAP